MRSLPFRLLLTLTLPLLLSACGESPGDALRMGLASAPVNLDPRFATDAASARVNRLLYRRLVDFDSRSLPLPSLADWEQLGPTRYRFTLGDEGREFSDGSRLDAQDVAATYRFILDPANASPHRTTLEMIEHIEVLDPDRLEFHLSRPDPLFPAFLVIGILPAELQAAGHPFASQPVGSGGCKLLDWPEEGRLLLERRRDGRRLELVRVSDPTVRGLKLLRGEIDLMQNDLPPELLAYLERQPEVRVERRRGSNFSYLGFNLQDPVTGRLEIRRAIAQAIDREAIIRYVLAGGAAPAQALLPPSHWAGHPNLAGFRFDPEAARRRLAAAGFGSDNPLRLVYKTSADPFRIRLATIIQSQLADVGIRVDLRSYDWGTFYGDIKAGRFQMYSLAWVGIETPDIFRYVFHSQSLPPKGANRGRYRDPEADRLIERAAGLGSLEAQAPVYRQLQARLLEQLPYVPLWYEDHVLVRRTGIENYQLAADGNYDGLLRVSRNPPAVAAAAGGG
jgi:peptide/nickel transport system substrate-binding protein